MERVNLSEFLRDNFPSKNVLRTKLVYGHGVNNADYMIRPSVSGVHVECPAYKSWSNMIRRAYSEKYQEKQPTYKGVVVCDEWLSFMTFREWWIENYKDGYHLDKDLLSCGGGVYGPEFCLYIPQWLNNFMTDRLSLRGQYPIGATLHKPSGKFLAQCNNPITGIPERLGYYSEPEQAHSAWLNRKIEICGMLKQALDSIDERIYNNAITMIEDKL